MTSMHPIHDINEVLHGADPNWSTEPIDQAEAIKKITAIVENEYSFAHIPTQALWQLGYRAHRVEGHYHRRQEYIGPDRIKPNLERVFIDVWAEENHASGGLNGGVGILQHLISYFHPEWPEHFSGDRFEWDIITKRDWVVSMAVVQWLGTNVGQGFLSDVQRRYEEWERKAKDELTLSAKDHQEVQAHEKAAMASLIGDNFNEERKNRE